MDKLDLTTATERPVYIGANYEVIVRLCNAPDLTLYDGYSQIYLDPDTRLVNFRTEVIDSKTFRLYINWDDFTDDIIAGTYEYDVLFVNKPANPSYRFYAVGGSVELIDRLSEVL